MTRVWIRRLLGGTVALGAMLAIASLSQLPYAMEGGDHSLIRLSWRTRGDNVQTCRPLTDEERRQLPPHMQPPEICEGRIAPYVLSVAIDGERVVRDTIHASGAREDRPLFVFRELPVPPGSHELVVDFVKIADDATAAGAAVAPSQLRLEATVRPRSGDVVLITYDAERRRLVYRSSVDSDG